MTLKNTDDCTVIAVTTQKNDNGIDLIEEKGFGKCRIVNEKKHIMYGLAGGGTVMINVSKDEVRIKRSGDVSTTMVYRQGEKTFFRYCLRYGELTMGIETTLIEDTMDKDGRLHMVYKLFSGDEQMCINDTVIEVKQ